MDQPENQVPGEEQKGSIGMIVGGIVILGVLILGGLYVWGAKIEKERQMKLGDDSTAENDAVDPNSPEFNDELPPPPSDMGAGAAGSNAGAEASLTTTTDEPVNGEATGKVEATGEAAEPDTAAGTPANAGAPLPPPPPPMQ